MFIAGVMELGGKGTGSEPDRAGQCTTELAVLFAAMRVEREGPLRRQVRCLVQVRQRGEELQASLSGFRSTLHGTIWAGRELFDGLALLSARSCWLR